MTLIINILIILSVIITGWWLHYLDYKKKRDKLKETLKRHESNKCIYCKDNNECVCFLYWN